MTEAYIYDAARTPRGKGRPDGSLHEVTSVALSARLLNAVKERNGLEGHAVEDVIWGNVTQVKEQGGCLARSAVLESDLDESIPGLAINRFCASGMEAVNLAANQVKGGAGQAYIAGGVEMMGRVAMGSDGAAIAVDPSLTFQTYFVPQGISADIIATEYGFTREQADALAVESQRRAAQAGHTPRSGGGGDAGHEEALEEDEDNHHGQGQQYRAGHDRSPGHPVHADERAKRNRRGHHRRFRGDEQRPEVVVPRGKEKDDRQRRKCRLG